MISRSTLIGALVVVELALVGLAVKAVAGDSQPSAFGFARHGRHHGFTTDGPVAGLEKTFAAGSSPRVVVDVHSVDVIVQSDGSPTVRVVEVLRKSGYVGGTIERVAATETAEGVRVATPRESGTHVMFGSLSHEVRIFVPAAAQVEVVSGRSVDVSGLRNKLIAHISEGVIKIRDHRGDVDVSTGDGRIYLTDVQGADIAGNTRSGRLYFTRVGADRIDAHTNFGRIYATDIRAVNGALTTKEGRVQVSFAGNSDAVVSASSHDGGAVTVSGLPSVEDGKSSRSVRFGSGRGRFEVSTDDEGPVAISQGANV
jgi:hypothetical protein